MYLSNIKTLKNQLRNTDRKGIICLGKDSRPRQFVDKGTGSSVSETKGNWYQEQSVREKNLEEAAQGAL